MYFLPRRVGLVEGQGTLIFTGRKVEVDEALALGIVDRKTTGDTLLADAQAWAAELSKGSKPQRWRSARPSSTRASRLSGGAGLRAGQPGAGHLLHEHRAPRVGDGFLAKSAKKDLSAMEALSTLDVSPAQAAQRRRHRRVGRRHQDGRPAGVSYLVKHGYAGEIYPVNPKADRIGGLDLLPDIASLPAVPDVGIVLLGAERAHLAVRGTRRRGAPSGDRAGQRLHRDRRSEGARRQARQLLEAAGPMRTARTQHHRPGQPDRPHRAVGQRRAGDGPLSRSARSAWCRRAAASSVRCCRAPRRVASACRNSISTSNEVDLDLADFVDHLAADDATRVIALYVETVRDPAPLSPARP